TIRSVENVAALHVPAAPHSSSGPHPPHAPQQPSSPQVLFAQLATHAALPAPSPTALSPGAASIVCFEEPEHARRNATPAIRMSRSYRAVQRWNTAAVRRRPTSLPRFACDRAKARGHYIYMQKLLACFVFLVACTDNKVDSNEQARRAYLGLDKSVSKS